MNETSRIWRAQRPLGWSPFWGTGSPSSRGWRLPLPIERPLLEHIQVGTVPGSQRGCPPPHFLLPSPSPSGCSSHSVFIIVLARCPSPLPGKSLQAGSLAGTCCLPCGCQHHPLSLPGLLVPGQATQGPGLAQAAPSPCVHPAAGGQQPLAQHPSTRPWLHPGKGGGQSKTSKQGRGVASGGARALGGGGSEAKIIIWSHLSKPINTIIPIALGTK